MKKLFLSIQALLFIAMLSACDGPKDSGTQTTNTEAVEPADLSPEASAPADAAKAVDSVQARESKMQEMVLGSVTIDNLVANFTERLGLSQQQTTSIKEILTKGFLATGRGLDKSYTFEESRTVKKEILHKSDGEITALLNETQKEQFKKFLER